MVEHLCVAGALWLLAVAIVRRGRLPPRTIWLVLGVAVAMRLLTLAAPPLLSSDLYRYVWDGRVQLAGINPVSLPARPPMSSPSCATTRCIRTSIAPTMRTPSIRRRRR